MGDDSDVEMLENLMYETGASSDDAFDALEATGYQGLDAAVEWLEQTLLRRTGLSIAEMEDYQAEMEGLTTTTMKMTTMTMTMMTMRSKRPPLQPLLRPHRLCLPP